MNNIYADIKLRSQGDIYVGVVGPVRTGKSTFISKFMNALVLPKITNKGMKQRTIDELPQSANGTMVMTMQPKFVPEKAITVELEKDVFANMRLIDCVGYLVEGATGAEDGGVARMVKTPWSDEEMPFEKAAEIGTSKVISSHSTIGVVVTTDGSVCDIKRENYINAENRVIEELLDLKKPFVVVVNSKNPDGENAVNVKNDIIQKYGVSVVCLDVLNMTEQDIKDIFEKVLYEFPVKKVDINLPDWARALDGTSSLISSVLKKLDNGFAEIKKMGDYAKFLNAFEDDENVEAFEMTNMFLGEGRIVYDLKINKKVFYDMLSEECGETICSDFELMKYVKQLSFAKNEYSKLESALEQVKQTGYGVVVPTTEDLVLEDPQIVKRANSSAVKLKASAPSLHIMRVDVETEIMPGVNAEGSDDITNYLVNQFENNPQGIWNTNMFGKPLSTLASEGISAKLVNLPVEAQTKMRKTLTKIVNENKGGIICILL